MFELGLSTSRAVCDVLCVKYLVSELLTLSCGTASAALVGDLNAEFREEFREHFIVSGKDTNVVDVCEIVLCRKTTDK